MYRLATAILFSLIVYTRADITLPTPTQKTKKREATPMPRPPQPVPVEVEVRRSGSVQISLKAIGMTSQPMKFRIKSNPEFGKLSEVVDTTPSSALVIYKHEGDLAHPRDQISFDIQTDQGVSSTAIITVKVLDEPPDLIIPPEIDFGTSLVGTTVIKEFQIVNHGGGTAEGELKVGPSLQLEPDNRYNLKPGEKKDFKLAFAAKDEEEIQTEIRYSSDPRQTTILHGKSRTPFAIVPKTLVLHAGEGVVARAGVLTIENRLDSPQTVSLQASARLQTKNEIELRAGGRVEVLVETAPGVHEEFKDELKITSLAYSTSVPVRAEAIKQIRREPRPTPTLLQPINTSPRVPPPINNTAPAESLALPRESEAPPSPISQDMNPAIARWMSIKVTNVTRTTCELAWSVAPELNPTHTIESQTPVIENGQVRMNWLPVSQAALKSRGSAVTAQISGLIPGSLYILRVKSVAENDPTKPMIAIASFRTLQPAKRSSAIVYLSIIALLGLTAVMIFRRVVANR